MHVKIKPIGNYLNFLEFVQKNGIVFLLNFTTIGHYLYNVN